MPARSRRRAKRLRAVSKPEPPALCCQLLRADEAAKLLQVAAKSLEEMRRVGDVPPFVRIGRSVRYRLDDLDDFSKRRRRRSTSDRGAP